MEKVKTRALARWPVLLMTLLVFVGCKSSEDIVANGFPLPDPTPGSQANPLLAHYQFAGDFTDSSTYHQDGVAYGGALAVSTGTINYLLLDGIDDYVEIPGTDSLLFQEGSIAFWLSPTTGGTIINKYDSHYDFAVDLLDTGTQWNIRPKVGFDAGGYGSGGSYESPFLNVNKKAAGSWYHIALVRTASYLIQVYVDGVRIENYQVTLETYHNRVTTPIRLGRRQSGGTNFFGGKLASVMIVNQALTQAQIQAIVALESPLYH